MESFIRNTGVSTEQIATIPEETVGLYMISLRDGERSFNNIGSEPTLAAIRLNGWYGPH